MKIPDLEWTRWHTYLTAAVSIIVTVVSIAITCGVSYSLDKKTQDNHTIEIAELQQKSKEYDKLFTQLQIGQTQVLAKIDINNQKTDAVAEQVKGLSQNVNALLAAVVARNDNTNKRIATGDNNVIMPMPAAFVRQGGAETPAPKDQ